MKTPQVIRPAEINRKATWSCMRKRLLHFCPFMQHGGTERHLHNLLQGLTHEFEVMLSAPTGPMTPAFVGKVEHLVPYPDPLSMRLHRINEVLRGIQKRLEGFEPDLIHIHASRDMAFAVRKVVRTMGIHCLIVLTPHVYTGIGDFLYTSLFARMIDRVIAVSDSEKARLGRFLPSSTRDEKVVRIFNGTPLADPDTRTVSLHDQESLVSRSETAVRDSGPDPETTVVGTVGRLSKEKGTIYLLRAFSIVSAEFPHIQLVIVGDGGTREALERSAQSLGIASKVRFTGVLDDPSSEVARFDIFVSPSLNETLSMSIIEAMALGKPVVATRVGATPEAVAHGDTGLICRPGSAEDLADGIRLLLASPDTRNRMGASGMRRATSLFSARGMIENTVRLYRDLLADEKRDDRPEAWSD